MTIDFVCPLTPTFERQPTIDLNGLLRQGGRYLDTTPFVGNTLGIKVGQDMRTRSSTWVMPEAFLVTRNNIPLYGRIWPLTETRPLAPAEIVRRLQATMKRHLLWGRVVVIKMAQHRYLDAVHFGMEHVPPDFHAATHILMLQHRQQQHSFVCFVQTLEGPPVLLSVTGQPGQPFSFVEVDLDAQAQAQEAAEAQALRMAEQLLAEMGVEATKPSNKKAKASTGTKQPSSPPPPPPPPPPSPAAPPDELVCPISLELMDKDPVVLAVDGFTYSKAAIEAYFARCRKRTSHFASCTNSPSFLICMHPTHPQAGSPWPPQRRTW